MLTIARWDIDILNDHQLLQTKNKIAKNRLNYITTITSSGVIIPDSLNFEFYKTSMER